MSDDTPRKYRPLFLIAPKSMSAKDIRRAEKVAGICIVECDAAEQARFLDAPMSVDLDAQARAALSLVRWVQGMGTMTSTFYKYDLLKFFVDQLLNAPKPAAVPPVKPVKK